MQNKNTDALQVGHAILVAGERLDMAELKSITALWSGWSLLMANGSASAGPLL
jgi:hypothetical protein